MSAPPFLRLVHGDTPVVRAVPSKPFCLPCPSAFPLAGVSFDIPASSEGALTCASKRGYAYLKFYTHEEGEEDRGFLRYPRARQGHLCRVPAESRKLWGQDRIVETTVDGSVRILIEGI